MDGWKVELDFESETSGRIKLLARMDGRGQPEFAATSAAFVGVVPFKIKPDGTAEFRLIRQVSLTAETTATLLNKLGV